MRIADPNNSDPAVDPDHSKRGRYEREQAQRDGIEARLLHVMVFAGGASSGHIL